MARVRIPKATEIRLLVLSRRRCCLCFGLDRDDSQKKGQIAHVDRNHANADLDNLAFLCVLHHDEYDSVPRQTRRLLPGELKHYRSELYEHLAQWPGKPPALSLTNDELRKWVGQKQRQTFAWLIVALIPLLLLMRMALGEKPVRVGAASAEPTISVIPEKEMRQDITQLSIAKLDLQGGPDRESHGNRLTSTLALPDEGKKAPNEVESTTCRISFNIASEHIGAKPTNSDTLVFNFLCHPPDFEAGEKFSSGTVDAALSAPSRDFQLGQVINLRWDNVRVQYLGSGEFSSTERLLLHSSTSLLGGGLVLSLQPSNLWAVRGFDPLGGSLALELTFAFFILLFALAWITRIPWERYLVRRYNLTVG